MKRHLYLGLGILLSLLVLGILSYACLRGAVEESERYLMKAAEAARAEDLPSARQYSRQAWNTWKHVWSLAACLVDHEAFQTIDQELEMLQQEQWAEDALAYGEQCLSLAEELHALQDSERVTFYNILAFFVNFNKSSG